MPVYGDRPGYSLDLMRRRPDSTNGITEYLIARAALALGAHGFYRLSLNFAAWGRLLDSAEDAGLSGRVQRAEWASSGRLRCVDGPSTGWGNTLRRTDLDREDRVSHRSSLC